MKEKECIASKTKRESNIELLRIIAIIMIIGHHFSIYAGNSLLIDNIINITSAHSIFLQILSYGGVVGNIIFVMISGYFIINKSFKFEKIIKFWLEVLFYSIIIYLLMCLLGCVNFEIGTFISYCLPISNFKYWFANAYIYLYFFSPFINILIKRLNQKSFAKLLILWPIIFIIPEIYLHSIVSYSKNEILSTTLIMIYIYSIGAYIQLYGIKFLEKISKTKLALLILIEYITLFLIRTYLEMVYIKAANYLLEFDSIFMISIAISIFYMFKKLNIKSNKVINYLESISFAVYLVQQNPVAVDYIWKSIFYIENKSIIQDLQLLILAIIAIYVVSIILESIRSIIEKFVEKKFNVEKVFKKVNNVLNIEEKESQNEKGNNNNTSI